MVKFFAFLLMIIDHSAIFFFPEHELILRSLGSLSFPLFAHFITQGLKYTKNLQLYIISLVTCACVTQPIFNILFPDLHRLNDLYTLLFGLIILVLYDRYGVRAFYLVILLLLSNVVSIYIYIVFAIYFLHHRPVYLLGALTVFFLLIYYLSGAPYVLFGPFSVLFMYNSATLPIPKAIQKYFYYVGYPLHFFIIFSLKSFSL